MIQLRHVSSFAELSISEPANLVFSVAVASGIHRTHETVRAQVDGEALPCVEIEGAGGTRLHLVRGAPEGSFRFDYEATVEVAEPPPAPTDLDWIIFTRPSRYCDSDRLAAVANTHFGHLRGPELLEGVVTWLLNNISYAPGSSDVVDGSLEAYLSRQGVCRDTAHLAVTFLRACNVPARLVSVYAPGLSPMDFHAVAEVCLDGQWYVIDGTGLAPRSSMVRIATGRDAADTAFLTTLSGRTELQSMGVHATVESQLPADDGTSLVQLA